MKNFEEYWTENKYTILKNNKRYQNAINKYKMTSGADWLLFGIPGMAGIIFFEYSPFYREIAKWVFSAVITIFTFIISVWIKSILVSEESPEQIEQEIKTALQKKIKEEQNMERNKKKC